MFSRMSLRKKLILSFAVVASLSVVLAASGYRGILFGIRAQGVVADEALPVIQILQRLTLVMLECQKTERTLSAPYIDAEALAIQRKNIEVYWKEAAEGTGEYEAIVRRHGSPDEVARMEEIQKLWKGWMADHRKVIETGLGGGKDASRLAWEGTFGPARTSLKALEKALHEETERQMTKTKEINRDFASRAASVKLTAIVLGLVIALASLAFGILTSSSLSHSLDRVARELDEGARQVDDAAAQLTASSQSMAEGSSEQAASLEETASAMEQMSAMTKQNSASALEARGLSDHANHSVGKADASMTVLVRQMNEISAMSTEVGKIIKTIDEIAFQTNLLALNAAVEAARAGEAGAGFAVVADEVRNLAQRAAGAAKNTAELIEGSIRKIQEGTGLVERTSSDFREVVNVVRKVMELVAEVAAASQEQSRGISEVTTAVDQMEKATQQNAAGAEEVAAASEELNSQTVALQDMVLKLREVVAGRGSRGVGGEDPIETPAAAPARPRRPAPAHREPASTRKRLAERS
jgi:methyl-accepting chemotaxis protein